MKRAYGTVIGQATETSERNRTTVRLLKVITGMEHSSASMSGSAEELEHAREVDGVQATMDAKELHCLFRHQVSNQIIDQVKSFIFI
jgi:hypothetical protein